MINLKTKCTICNGNINLPEDVEVSEIITCGQCQSKLAVKKIEANKVILNEAPQVEEDWGE